MEMQDTSTDLQDTVIDILIPKSNSAPLEVYIRPASVSISDRIRPNTDVETYTFDNISVDELAERYDRETASIKPAQHRKILLCIAYRSYLEDIKWDIQIAVKRLEEESGCPDD